MADLHRKCEAASEALIQVAVVYIAGATPLIKQYAHGSMGLTNSEAIVEALDGLPLETDGKRLLDKQASKKAGPLWGIANPTSYGRSSNSFLAQSLACLKRAHSLLVPYVRKGIYSASLLH